MPITEATKQHLFTSLQKIIAEYCPPLVFSRQTSDTFEVIGNTPTPYGSKKVIVPGMYMASAIIRKDSVTFYFFPTYMNEPSYKPLAPKLWKTLKGKTCFHLKKEADLDSAEIKAIFKIGVAFYKKQGWIK